ncbi:MAG: hypothetical protein NZ932_05805 [Candidatus Bathyarchaeota archaeon]|nr:hypothetical protein [Candidatus Bathyarchaeota archaeon]
MPVITPSYLYTFFALIAVSSILLVSFMEYANAIRFSFETRKLKELMDHVAAEAIELVTMALTANASTETIIQAPPAMGEKQYWLTLKNDSARAWLEGGFGNLPTENTALRVYLACKAEATGYYISGYGAIRLTCSASADAPRIILSGLSQKGE